MSVVIIKKKELSIIEFKSKFCAAYKNIKLEQKVLGNDFIPIKIVQLTKLKR